MSENNNSKKSENQHNGAGRGGARGGNGRGRGGSKRHDHNAKRAGENPPAKADSVLGVRELILRPDKTSNFMDWREEMEKYIFRHYGYHGEIIRSEKHYEFVLPKPDLEAIRELRNKRESLRIEEEAIEEIPLQLQEREQKLEARSAVHDAAVQGATAKSQKDAIRAEREAIEHARNELREAHIIHMERKDAAELMHLELDAMENFNRENDKMRLKDYHDEKRQYEKENPEVYQVIWETLSRVSRDMVKLEDAFVSAEAKREPLLLYKVVKKIHLVSPGANMAITKMKRMSDFSFMRQRNDEPLREYLARFRQTVDGMEHAGLEVPAEDVQTAKFLEGLERDKFSEMQRNLYNDSLTDAEAYPKTLNQAMVIAQQYLVPRKTGGGNISAAFLTTATGGKNKKKKDRSTKQKRANDRADSGDVVKETQGDSDSHKEEAAAVRSSTKRKTVICYKCGEEGHISVNCPLNRDQSSRETANFTQAAFPVTIYSFPAIDEGTVNEFTVLFDNNATECVFKNRNMLTGIMTEDQPMGFNGIGGAVVAKESGIFGQYGRVWISNQAPVNILSWSAIRRRLKVKIFYDNEKDELSVNFRNGLRHVYSQAPIDGLYAKDFRRQYACLTRAERDSMLPVSDIEKAKKARDFWERIGPVSEDQVKILTRRASTRGVSARDIENSKALYGPNVGCIKGKATEPSPLKDRGEKLLASENQHLTMHSDLMFISTHVFLVTRMKPIGLAMTTHLGHGEGPKSPKMIAGGLRGQIATATAHNFVIVKIFFDGEGAVEFLRNAFQAMGIIVERRPGHHIPVAEALIKGIKGYCRGVISLLEWTLPEELVPDLVKFATQRLNLLETKSGLAGVPPIEAFTGIPVDVDLEARLKFGQYVQAVTPNLQWKNNVFKERSVGAIVISQEGRSGALGVRSLRTRKKLVRTKVFPLPTTDIVIQAMNSWAGGAPAPQAFGVDEDVEEEVKAPELHHPERVEDVVQTRPELLTGTQDVVEFIEEKEPSHELPQENTSEDASGDMLGVIEDPTGDELRGEVSEYNQEPSEDNENTRRSTRIAGQAPRDYKRLSALGHAVVKMMASAYHLSVKKAIELYGGRATDAVKAELEQIHAKGVFKPVKWETISRTQRKRVIRSFMFMKEKYAHDGVLEKIKARLVANGKMQDKDLYEDISSPTASVMTLFTVAMLAARDNLEVATGDITGAYLNAKMPSENERVIVILDREVASILCNIEPEYKVYVRQDGCMPVQLEGALYGCIESALLWYLEMRTQLLSMEFRCCDTVDKCLFINDRKNIILVLYVDDIFVVARNGHDITWLFEKLDAKYGRLTRNIGEKVLSYLGMRFDFSVRGVCEITMKAYIDSLLVEYERTRKTLAPCGEELFVISEESDLLDEKSQEDFHSLVAKLLYLAKRVKPGILTGVSFLTTRVKKANIGDARKLLRIMDFLKTSNEYQGIRMSAGSYNFKNNIVSGFIDAAFACHWDYKSHSGMVIFVNGCPVYFASNKQKTVAKSSFEGEVNGVSDGGSVIIHAINLLGALCKREIKAYIHQDNEGAISAMNSGICSGKNSKHINVRIAWVAEQIKLGTFTFIWTPTDEMIADGLTKALVGSKFRNFEGKATGYELLS